MKYLYNSVVSNIYSLIYNRERAASPSDTGISLSINIAENSAVP